MRIHFTEQDAAPVRRSVTKHQCLEDDIPGMSFPIEPSSFHARCGRLRPETPFGQIRPTRYHFRKILRCPVSPRIFFHA